MKKKFKKLLSRNTYDGVIHLAAVSDFSPVQDQIDRKISSNCDFLNIKLKKNRKLIYEIKNFSKNKNIKVIGYKLTYGLSEEEEKEQVDQMLSSGKVDLAVHNDYRKIQGERHCFSIYKNQWKVSEGESKKEMYEALKNFLLVSEKNEEISL